MSLVDQEAQIGLQRSRRLVLPEFIARNARRAPERVALAFGDQELTYAELDDRTSRVAQALIARGVEPGDRVAVMMYNRIEMVEAFFGCLKAGACAVPLNFRLVQAEVDYILSHAGAVAVIADEPLADRASTAVDNVDSLRSWLSVGVTPKGAEPYESALADADARSPDRKLDDEDVAFLMYTSGTTGRPKGAMLTHQNLFCQTVNMTYEVGINSQDVWRSGAPLFHIAGLAGILPLLYLGGKSVVAPSTAFDAEEAVDDLRRHGVTMAFFVPTQWDIVCAHPRARSLTELRVGIWGASPATRATLERMGEVFVGVDILSNFGQTEMCPSTTWLKGADSIRKMGSVGKPSINVDVRIVDEDMNDVTPGEVGEIVYRGPTVMKGYHDDERATAEAFAGGWFHSGDLVRQDDEGYIYVVDRKKDMIISGGENVYPAEVEAVLASHSAVADVAVIGVPHDKWVETPIAVVVRAGEVTAGELIEHCRAHLAGYKKPSTVEFVEELPRNATGKVLKRQLRERYADEHTI